VRTHELDFVAFRRRLAGEAPPQIILDQLDIFGPDEITQRPADHLVRAHAEQREKARVGEENLLAVDQHGVVHGFHQTLEQLLTPVQIRATLFETLEQFVDREAELLERLRITLETDATGAARFEREAADLLGENADRALLAPLPDEERDDSRDQQGETEKQHGEGGQDQRGPRWRRILKMLVI
jgi:hypothetical protein